MIDQKTLDDLRAAEKDYFEGKTPDKLETPKSLKDKAGELLRDLKNRVYEHDVYRAEENERIATEHNRRLFDLDQDYHRRVMEDSDNYYNEMKKLRKFAEVQRLVDTNGRHPWEEDYQE